MKQLEFPGNDCGVWIDLLFSSASNVFPHVLSAPLSDMVITYCSTTDYIAALPINLPKYQQWLAKSCKDLDRDIEWLLQYQTNMESAGAPNKREALAFITIYIYFFLNQGDLKIPWDPPQELLMLIPAVVSFPTQQQLLKILKKFHFSQRKNWQVELAIVAELVNSPEIPPHRVWSE